MLKHFFKKIIVAINGRKSSIEAAMYAIMMAKSYGLSLKFVYVVDTATIKMLLMNKLLISDEKDDLEARLKIDGNNYLSYVESLAASKGLKVEKELLSGSVFTEIIKAAEAYEADLILLGGSIKLPGRSEVKSKMMSKDENEILANSSCPVLIVQKPQIEEQFKIF